ncbi:transglycosylase SLT domain-containing protein [Nonomuraea purpurea]|uniref:Transglycosylase SLT domain-containing protein n=1 Tax=Nonomuraea purpurea TaxID=1849276 RepID=A0ABV8GPA7_9ACTN
MSVSDLPGGAALQEMLRKVTGDTVGITSIATSWRSVSGDVDEFGSALAGAVRTVDQAWNGRSADAFDTYMRKYGTAAGDLKTALTNSATSLDNAARALGEAHSEISAICRDLNTTAANYKTTYYADNPDATEDDVKPGLTRLVNQAKEDARPWVNSANTAVTKAKNEIDRFLEERGTTFRGIPEVASQHFTPAPGRTIDWKRDPGYQEQNGTSTQSANGGGGGGFGGYGSSGPPPAVMPSGEVKGWIQDAIRILEARGVPASKMNPDHIAMIIQHESGGNPNAINTWDSNAEKGTPSKGLMQTIDPTFNAYALSGKNIYDPVDNIVAGVRYAIARYGSVSNVPGVVNVSNGGAYVGY